MFSVFVYISVFLTRSNVIHVGQVLSHYDLLKIALRLQENLLALQVALDNRELREF
jgi:hypothetical protein